MASHNDIAFGRIFLEKWSLFHLMSRIFQSKLTCFETTFHKLEINLYLTFLLNSAVKEISIVIQNAPNCNGMINC